MEKDTQRVIAVWTVFLLPFLVIGGSLFARDRLTLEVVSLYWFPAIILTAIGVIPPPWKPLGN